jgi:uncharacterized protein YdeI (YjbR/CyaY-like superfamily)
MDKKDNYPVLFFETQQAWEDWLAENHAAEQGAWLKFAKKDSGIDSINYQQAVEGALCYGWIDGQSKSVDHQYWLQKFTPRKTKSNWSVINREKVEALIAAGRVQPAGMNQVELAKADGRWDAAYDSPTRIGVPEDFQAELDRRPEAKEFFSTLNSANRYAVLYRIQTAKKPETRAARIQKLVEMLAKNEKIHP